MARRNEYACGNYPHGDYYRPSRPETVDRHSGLTAPFEGMGVGHRRGGSYRRRQRGAFQGAAQGFSAQQDAYRNVRGHHGLESREPMPQPPSGPNKRKRNSDGDEESDPQQDHRAPSKAPRLSGHGSRVQSLGGAAPRYDSTMSGFPQNGNQASAHDQRTQETDAGGSLTSGTRNGQQQGSTASSAWETDIFDPMDQVDVDHGRAHARRNKANVVELQVRPVGQERTEGAKAIDGYVGHLKEHKLRREDIDGPMCQDIGKNPKKSRKLAQNHNMVGAWIHAQRYANKYKAAKYRGKDKKTVQLQIGTVFSGADIRAQGDRNIPITDLNRSHTENGKVLSKCRWGVIIELRGGHALALTTTSFQGKQTPPRRDKKEYFALVHQGQAKSFESIGGSIPVIRYSSPDVLPLDSFMHRGKLAYFDIDATTMAKEGEIEGEDLGRLADLLSLPGDHQLRKLAEIKAREVEEDKTAVKFRAKRLLSKYDKDEEGDFDEAAFE